MSPKSEFDAYACNYQVQLDEKLKFFGAESQKYARRKVLLIKDTLNKQEQNIHHILDFGCGTGVMTSELYSLFPNANIFGTDPSSKSLKIAIENSNPNINYLAPQALQKKQLQFNLIVAANVFHHIPFVEHIEQLRKLQKHLTTGGYIFLFEHNPLNPLTTKVVRDCKFDQDATLLKPKYAKSIAKHCGFIIEDLQYYLFFPPHWDKLVKLERLLKWFPLGAQYCLVIKK